MQMISYDRYSYWRDWSRLIIPVEKTSEGDGGSYDDELVVAGNCGDLVVADVTLRL